jgi:hypothetical protein
MHPVPLSHQELTMSNHKGKRKGKRKPSGWSENGSKQMWNLFFGLAQINRNQKRNFFNNYSYLCVLIAGSFCALIGFTEFGLSVTGIPHASTQV